MVLGLHYHSQQLSQHHSRQKQKGKSEGETQIQEHTENKREIEQIQYLMFFLFPHLCCCIPFSKQLLATLPKKGPVLGPAIGR